MIGKRNLRSRGATPTLRCSQTCLCVFQSFFSQIRPQYDTALHFEHVLGSLPSQSFCRRNCSDRSLCPAHDASKLEPRKLQRDQNLDSGQCTIRKGIWWSQTSRQVGRVSFIQLLQRSADACHRLLLRAVAVPGAALSNDSKMTFLDILIHVRTFFDFL